MKFNNKFKDLLSEEDLEKLQEVVDGVEKKRRRLEERRFKSLPKHQRRFMKQKQ